MALSVAAIAARIDLADDLISAARIVMSSVAPVPLIAEQTAAELVDGN